MSSQVVCILGMHRSGTSCLAGSLQSAGLFLGNVITEAPHNARGNRENKQIMDLHEDVITHSGGRWDAPPERIAWTNAHRARRDEIIASYGDAEQWGFKDPRTLLTVDGWREALDDMVYVASFRHPAAVTASLRKRNGGPPERWLELWRVYNRKLLACREQHGATLVCFDRPDDEYVASLGRVARELGLDPDASGFYDAELRHHEATPDFGPLPDDVAELYEELLDASREGASP